ncbi:MAG: excinuclease ABC subunit A, partial [Verrucomicrobiota bacterium]
DTLLVDGEWKKTEGFQRLARFKEHTIDVLIADVDAKMKLPELQTKLEMAFRVGKKTAKFMDAEGEMHILSTSMVCPETGRAFEELDPRLFSYNSPHGWCPTCRGYGTIWQAVDWNPDDRESLLAAELEEEMRRSRADKGEQVPCPACEGARLNEVALHVRIDGVSIDEIARLSVRDAAKVLGRLKFSSEGKRIARDILPEIDQRLRFLDQVGLGYLDMNRSATTLSGGESQRIRLAAQLGSNLRGVLYILDEPTIGLHPRDNEALLDTMTALKKKGNSLVVVEHDEETMRRSDLILDLGPGAGQFGGEITAQGTLAQISRKKGSVTGAYLKEPLRHPLRGERRPLPGRRQKGGWLTIKGANANNLKNIEVAIPLGRFTGIAGISGSGKSSFMRGVLKPAVEAVLKAKGKPVSLPAGEKTWKSISGAQEVGALYEVDQSPIGKTSRSTPATYVKVFDESRKLFAALPAARARGYAPGRFSFNTEGGRCESCKGHGAIRMEMNFLPTTHVPCDDCGGLRYNAATLEVLYHDKNIGQVMGMTIAEACQFFESNPKIQRTLNLLVETGLGYLKLGQASPTLSGG